MIISATEDTLNQNEEDYRNNVNDTIASKLDIDLNTFIVSLVR